MIGGVYIAVSALLITFNKYMMQPGHFPHAVHLTATHMAVTSIMSMTLYGLAPQLFPSMVSVKGNMTSVLKYICPLGCLFAFALLFSNIAYTYSTVAFLQFCKEANVAIVFIMSCIVGTQVFSLTKAGILSVVIAGCTLCVDGELKFVWIGLIVQLASQFAECSKNLIAEVVMSGAGLKLDVLTFVMFQAPCSLAPLLIGFVAQWTPQIGQDFIRMWPLLLLNALVAFLECAHCIDLEEVVSLGICHHWCPQGHRDRGVVIDHFLGSYLPHAVRGLRHHTHWHGSLEPAQNAGASAITGSKEVRCCRS
jgi:hypothetical protein